MPERPGFAVRLRSTGEGNTESDIDLFIVRPNDVSEDDDRWRSQIDRLAADVLRWTGNHVGIAEVAEPEIDRLERDQPPILAELRSDAIALSGPEVVELLGARR